MSEIVRSATIKLLRETTLRVHAFDNGKLVLALDANSVGISIHMTAEQAAALARALAPKEGAPVAPKEATPLLPVGTRVMAVPKRVEFDRPCPGTIFHVDPDDPIAPYRVRFDSWPRLPRCSAEDVQPLADATP